MHLLLICAFLAGYGANFIFLPYNYYVLQISKGRGKEVVDLSVNDRENCTKSLSK